jgi:hypothetical protein
MSANLYFERPFDAWVLDGYPDCAQRSVTFSPLPVNGRPVFVQYESSDLVKLFSRP